MRELNTAVRRTLCYFEIFGYSPSQEELYKYLIGYRCSPSDLEPFVGHYPKKQAKTALLLRKLSAAERLAALAGRLPGVGAVFLTGDLAAGAAREDSDADFLVITRKGKLRSSRWLLCGLFSGLGIRKSRFNITPVKTSACFNIFLEQGSLAMPREKRNLFVAQEIARVRPLVDKGCYYGDFLSSNPWVLRFLPNFLPSSSRLGPADFKTRDLGMAPADRGQLFLHTKDLTKGVLRRYKENCEREGVSPGEPYDT